MSLRRILRAGVGWNNGRGAFVGGALVLKRKRSTQQAPRTILGGNMLCEGKIRRDGSRDQIQGVFERQGEDWCFQGSGTLKGLSTEQIGSKCSFKE